MGRKKYSMNIRCYNCGRLTPGDEMTWEHVPMDALYRGFTERDKLNRIKVHGCRSCNQKYSHIEQRLRNMIAVIGRIKHRDDLSEIIQASDRSLKVDKEYRGQWIKLEDDKYYFSFASNDFDQIHIKNLKGIIYKEFDYVLLDDEYMFRVGSDYGSEVWGDDQMRAVLNRSLNFSLRQPDWKGSGNLDIFKYRFGYDFDLRGKRPDKIQDAGIIHCMMMYHNLIFAHVMAYRNDVAEKL